MLKIVPISLREANAFVEKHHRHHGVVRGHKFSVAVAENDCIVGVAIVGRPINRTMDDGWTLEVTRVCTDGKHNACSILYAAAWRVTRALGYRKIITYILKSETGTSLKASGWVVLHQTKGHSWNCPSRPRIDRTPIEDKVCYGLELK